MTAAARNAARREALEQPLSVTDDETLIAELLDVARRTAKLLGGIRHGSPLGTAAVQVIAKAERRLS